MQDALQQGRECWRLGSWDEAYVALRAADREAPLGCEDLDRLATAAYLTGREPAFLAALERAHDAHAAAGECERAARCAFWLAMTRLLRGEAAASGGWLARAQRLLEDRACAEQGYLLLPLAERQLGAGSAGEAGATAARAATIGMRFGDDDLVAIARHVEGRAQIGQERVAEGLRLLDEAMLGVVLGQRSPIVTGLLYCSVIDVCRQLHELRRAAEWTAAFERWCERQRGLVAFSGACRVHRAEVLEWHGAWPDALDEAARACERDGAEGGRAQAAALVLQGDVRRLRGEFDAAERAYRDASRLGGDPQPGLALLRHAQGRTAAALAAIRRALAEAGAPLERARLLPALAEIGAASGRLDEARAAVAELERIATRHATLALEALAAQARGEFELADGRPQAALAPLRRAFEAWQRLDAPYPAARARAGLARACDALGDHEAAALEREAARATFERLGAAPPALPGTRRDRGGALSDRERQVLRLVAEGRTNKAIALALALSERTVDRHLSNIFDKLGVSSRAAATACALERGLL